MRVAVETVAATLLSSIALALVARRLGGSELQPINATSHLLNGPVAAEDCRTGWRTTGVETATHVAAMAF